MMWTEATNKQEDGGELCDAQRFRSNKIGMWIALSLSCSLSVIVPVTAQPSLPPPAASEPNVPLSPSERRGFRLVRLNCARCHAINKISESSLAIALRSARCISSILSQTCNGPLRKGSTL